MGIFDIFKRTKKLRIPDSYRGIISDREYCLIMDLSVQYHKEKGLKVLQAGDGEIVTEVNNVEQHRYLDNLVRILASNKKESWKSLIYEHFDKLKDNSAAYNFFYKDFEFAEPLLRILIKPDDFNLGDNTVEFVHRIDFPMTMTFLVLEFEDQFHFVARENIKEWNKSEDELFQIALSNLPGEEVEIKEYVYLDKYTVFTFFSGDYSSALMLDLPNRADFTIGTYGSLIAIPTKGTAFVHPIESGELMELIGTLYPAIEQFYNEDPGCITTNFYWFYENEFQVFPPGQDTNGTFIKMPEGLTDLISNS